MTIFFSRGVVLTKPSQPSQNESGSNEPSQVHRTPAIYWVRARLVQARQTPRLGVDVLWAGRGMGLMGRYGPIFFFNNDFFFFKKEKE